MTTRKRGLPRSGLHAIPLDVLCSPINRLTMCLLVGSTRRNRLSSRPPSEDRLFRATDRGLLINEGSDVRFFGIGGHQAWSTNHASFPPIPKNRTPDPGLRQSLAGFSPHGLL